MDHTGLRMECERWLNVRMGVLQMRIMIEQDFEPIKIPEKIDRRILKFDPNEINVRGETLFYAVIRYITDVHVQIRYLNMLIRAGSDPSMPDRRSLRTPLMLAIMLRNETVTQMLIDVRLILIAIIQHQVSLTESDRLGNTALMYAALCGNASIVHILVDALTKKWSFDVFKARNIMGYTAEELARKNGHRECALQLQRERIQMLQRMHRQLALIHMSASMRGWTNYTAVYKAKQAFLQRRRTSMVLIKAARTRSMFPIISDIKHSLHLSQSLSDSDFQDLLVLPHIDKKLSESIADISLTTIDNVELPSLSSS